MNRILLLCSIAVLLIMFFSVAHGQISPATTAAPTIGVATTPAPTIGVATTPAPTIAVATTTAATTGTTTTGTTTTGTTTTTRRTTSLYRRAYGGYGSGSGGSYGGGIDGYYNDQNEVIGQGGIDPRKYGTDIGDFGPVNSNGRSMLSSLDLFIIDADNPDKGSPGQSYPGVSSGGYSGSRDKRSYSRVRFPVRQFRKPRQFPSRFASPLISISPVVPIFYDKLTYQTVIFSPAGGLIIIPPIINFYGRRFAVAQLIKWGYASLVSSGAPIGPGVDVGPLVQPGPPVNTGIVGSKNMAPPPTFDSKSNRFNGGIKTNFQDFKPRYSQVIEEGGNPYYERQARPNYGPDNSYGGTRNQQIYPQGGPRGAGGY